MWKLQHKIVLCYTYYITQFSHGNIFLSSDKPYRACQCEVTVASSWLYRKNSSLKCSWISSGATGLEIEKLKGWCVNNQVLTAREGQNLKGQEVIMCCLVSAATHQRVQWYRSREKCCIHEKTEKSNETWRKNSVSMSVHPPQIPHKVLQDSTTALQSEDSTLLLDNNIQQYSLEMWTAQLYGHCTGTALYIDTRTNTKCRKVQQLTDSGYQDLQHHWLIPDRLLKRISDTICTTTAEHVSRTAIFVLTFSCEQQLPSQAFKFYFGW